MIPKSFLNDKGEIVSGYYKGRIYNFLAKFEKERGLIKRIIFTAIALLVSALTFGAAPYFSSTIRDLFSEKDIVVLRSLHRNENANQDFLGKDISNVKSFTIEDCNGKGKHMCAAIIKDGYKELTYMPKLPQSCLLIKDILTVLPKTIIQYGGDLNHFANLQYPKVEDLVRVS